MATWTEADLAMLRAAVASGVLTVSYAGPPARTITYQSLDSMRRLLAEMTRDVAGSSAVTHRNASFSKGFDRAGRCGFRRND